MYVSLPPRSPWRPSRKDSGLIKSWFVLHLANFLSGYRLKPLNRPTAEVPPICRVYSASVRRFSRDGRLGKVGWKEGGGGERGVERNGTIAVGTQSLRANPGINRRGTNVYQVAVVQSRLSCQTFRTFRGVFLLTRFAIVLGRLPFKMTEPPEKLACINLDLFNHIQFPLFNIFKFAYSIYFISSMCKKI